jgi:hypothetical protein
LSLLYYKKTENLRNLKDEYEDSSSNSSSEESESRDGEFGTEKKPRIVVNDPKDFLLDKEPMNRSKTSMTAPIIKRWFNKSKESQLE